MQREKLLLFAAPACELPTTRIASNARADAGKACVRRFPDGETYVRLDTPVAGRDVAIIGDLHRPDDKLLPILLLADTARELGAERIGLVAPYLPYLRQDRRFHAGEGMTSRYFARLVSMHFDWLATVDPHLHRFASLDELYPIPSSVAHAAPAIGSWIATNVTDPLVIGPDAESVQWANAVAATAQAPFMVLQKTRRSETDVSVSVPDFALHRDRTPILIDDIVSTAHTMIEAIRHLREAGARPPVCIAVHAVFADGAYDALRDAGPAQVATCNTILHASNAIDVMPALGAAVRTLGTLKR